MAPFDMSHRGQPTSPRDIPVETNLVDFFSDIFKASFNHPFPISTGYTHELPKLLARFNESIPPFKQVRCAINRIVVTEDPDRGVGYLEPSAILQILQSLTK
jgi:hypothetical protein